MMWSSSCFFFSSLLHFYQITEWFSLSLLHNSEKQSGSMMKKLSHVGILYSHISHYYYILETFQWWQAYTEEFKRPRFHLRSQSDATRHYVTNTHYSQGFCCCVAMFFSVSRNQTLCTHNWILDLTLPFIDRSTFIQDLWETDAHKNENKNEWRKKPRRKLSLRVVEATNKTIILQVGV